MASSSTMVRLAGLNRLFPSRNHARLWNASRIIVTTSVPNQSSSVGAATKRSICCAGILPCPGKRTASSSAAHLWNVFGRCRIPRRHVSEDSYMRPTPGFAGDEQAVLDHATPMSKLFSCDSYEQSTANLQNACADVGSRADKRALEGPGCPRGGRSVTLKFSDAHGLARRIPEFPHLAILRTLSKRPIALAGARCGTLIADPEVHRLTAKVIAALPPSPALHGSGD